MWAFIRDVVGNGHFAACVDGVFKFAVSARFDDERVSINRSY